MKWLVTIAFGFAALAFILFQPTEITPIALLPFAAIVIWAWAPKSID